MELTISLKSESASGLSRAKMAAQIKDEIEAEWATFDEVSVKDLTVGKGGKFVALVEYENEDGDSSFAVAKGIVEGKELSIGSEGTFDLEDGVGFLEGLHPNKDATPRKYAEAAYKKWIQKAKK